MSDKPFDTIESAIEFLALFEEAIEETVADVQKDLEMAETDDRRGEALRIAVYKLEKLGFHIGRSKRLTNDLRMLRRLLLNERIAVRQQGVEEVSLVETLPWMSD